jgi:hypothetical protein
MMKDKEKILNWYHKEVEKDKVDVDKFKNDFIKTIKNVDRNQMFTNPKEEKLTLWQRLKKVLMGT